MNGTAAMLTAPSLTIREMQFHVAQPGCRSREIVVATTLLDERAYQRTAIAEIYHRRWHVEIDIQPMNPPNKAPGALLFRLLAGVLTMLKATGKAWERSGTSFAYPAPPGSPGQPRSPCASPAL